MSKEKKKNTFVMVVLMALPVVLGGMFIISKEFKKDEVSLSTESLIIPDVDEMDEMDDDKAKIYRDEQTELMYRRNQDARNIASDKDFFAIDSDYGKDEKSKEQTFDRDTQLVLAEYQEQETASQLTSSKIEEKVYRSENQNHSQTQLSTTNRVRNSNEEQFYSPAENLLTGTLQDEMPRRRSSMGVYTSDRFSTPVPTDTKMDQSRKFLRAVLEEDKVIQNGSNVIFVLSDDGNIEGTNHKRGSILYGRAIQGREFFEISIYQVKSANDGKIYPADLVVFDENYNRGIRSEGFLNEVSREEGADAATKTIDEATQGVSSVRALDMATRAITRTASRTTRSKPATIPLRKGYKVYLQPKTKE